MVLLSPTVARFLTHFLAYLYPAYESFKAVRDVNPDLHAKWLTYWIANSYFVFFEILGDVILSNLPLYYELKIALLIWLVTPRFNGADKIYKQVIHPYLVRYETDIDESLNALKETGVDKLGELRDAGVRQIRSGSNDLVRAGQQVMLSTLLAVSKEESGGHRKGSLSVTD